MEMFIYLVGVVFMIAATWSVVVLSKANPVILWIYVPLNIFVAVSTIFVYDALLGGPTRRDLPPNFNLIHYYVDEPKAIYLWITPAGSKVPVYHARPYSKDEHQKLTSLEKPIKEGKVRGKPKIGDKPGVISREQSLEYYDFTKDLKFPDKQ